MPNNINYIKNIFSFNDIIKLSNEKIQTSPYKSNPWAYPGMDHGTALLDTDEQLYHYIAAYGEMHKTKINTTLQHFPINDITDNFEIIDWGCGQGLASICFMDYLKENTILLNKLKKITLVEPSECALNTANVYISSILKNLNIEIDVKTIKKYLPVVNNSNDDIKEDDINVNYNIVIHLFSNILDIEEIDLKKIANIIAKKGYKNYILCVSPLYSSNDRLNNFCRYFNLDKGNYFNHISSSKIGHLSNGYYYGCEAIGFKFIVNTLKPILFPISFYPSKQFFAAYKLDLLDQYGIDYLSKIKEKAPFEVLAPFDIGANIYEDIDPILAVLNNIIVRGLPTRASVFVEDTFNKVYKIYKNDQNNDVINYTREEHTILNEEDMEILKNSPIAIARLEKVILEAMLTNKISYNKDKWSVLVKEEDVPCAAIAFEDLQQMFNNLTAISEAYPNIKFPEIDLTIISNKYSESKLHVNCNKVYNTSNTSIVSNDYDMVLDISMDLISDPKNVQFSEFKALNNCYFNIRSSNEIFSERHIYTTDLINYKLFTIKNTQGYYEPIEDNIKHLRYFLQLLFRKKDFREGQLPILTRALENKSVIGLLPTGGGKSLTYQLSAMLQPGVSIIIDPLVSLMMDQYNGLLNNGIDYCTYINSMLTAQQKRKNQNLIENSQIIFIFLSPERLCINEFRKSLRNMHNLHIYFSYGIIDEVHCVSEWGHDFRFSYLHLGRNLYQYVLPKKNHITLFGLTATASFDVLADVERELSGDNAFPLDSDATVRYENTNRLELQYLVLPIIDNNARNKWDIFYKKNKEISNIIIDISKYIKELQTPAEIQFIKKSFIDRENISNKKKIKEIYDTNLSINVLDNWYNDKDNKCAAIVFCPHRNGYIGVQSTMQNRGIYDAIIKDMHLERHQIGFFLGGSDNQYMLQQNNFLQNKTSIMVATKAFGMGIDKSNVRFTINVNYSQSLEAFVQEAGRAGRDRKMALSIILYNDKFDRDIQEFFYNSNFMGEKFEKIVMNFLMNNNIMQLENEENTISGFFNTLLNTEVGNNVTYLISYSYSSNNSNNLDNALITHNLQKIGANHNSIEEKANRYKEALQKAIYRMCCINVIDDYTEDYINKNFRIVATKKDNGGYYESLKHFLMKYYTEERANIEVENAKTYKGNNEIYKCLGYLTEFVYTKIAIKRQRAIDDMETFCASAVRSNENWLKANEDLKDYIYYYFNSKYAREKYQTEYGEDFSLLDDSEKGKKSSFDIVFKYMRVIDNDVAGSSSTKDNIKHLQGAIRLIKRALTDTNPSLDFLNVFCLLFLKIKDNEDLKLELRNSYINGYMDFYNRTDNKELFYNNIKKFKENLTIDNRKVATKQEIKYLKELDYIAELNIHSIWLNNFKKQYCINK